MTLQQAFNCILLWNLWMSMEWRDVLAEFFKYLRSPKDDVVGAITEGISKISDQLISGCKRFSGA